MRAQTAPASINPNALHYQEILFSLVMTFVAVLSRDNALVRYPDILRAFLAMLGFNLAYHRLLRRGGDAPIVPLVSMAVNITLVSLILAFSGGDQSRFWPLYMLPIFTACLHLSAAHVVAACAAAGAFLAYFYLEAFWELARWESCEFAIKSCVLAFSAAVTAHLSFRERAQRRELDQSRAAMEELARSLERRSAGRVLEMTKESMDSVISGIVHHINNPLTVILGSVELLLKEAPEGSVQRQDLERIRSAAGRCARVTEDLLAYSQSRAAALP